MEPVGDKAWLSLELNAPSVSADAWVAPGATLVGAVRVRARASVWYATVLRADGDVIDIGEESNIQDGCVLHTDPGYPLMLERGVSVGHCAVLHGCQIAEDVLVGMGAVVMNGAQIGRGSIVAAGAVVPAGMRVPDASLVAGVPARVRRGVTSAEHDVIRDNARQYLELTARHRQLHSPREP